MKNWLIKLLGGYLQSEFNVASISGERLHFNEVKEAITQGRQEAIAEIYAMAEQQQPIGLAPPTGDPEDMIILTVDEFANDIGEVTVH